jgi:hypothetical protein
LSLLEESGHVVFDRLLGDAQDGQVGSVVPVCLESAQRRAANERFVNSFSVRSPLHLLCATACSTMPHSPWLPSRSCNTSGSAKIKRRRSEPLLASPCRRSAECWSPGLLRQFHALIAEGPCDLRCLSKTCRSSARGAAASIWTSSCRRTLPPACTRCRR